LVFETVIIYKAYLDYGPYNGEEDLGYFLSVQGAYGAVTKSCKEHNFALDHPETVGNRTSYRALDYEGVSWVGDYKFVIETIEVQP